MIAGLIKIPQNAYFRPLCALRPTRWDLLHAVGPIGLTHNCAFGILGSTKRKFLSFYGLLQTLPEIEPVLAQLAGKLTTADLIEEVHKLSVEGSHPAIARDLVRRFIDRKKL